MDDLLKVAMELDSTGEKPRKKRGKPEKTCPECNAVNHARSSNCKECDYQFYVRKKKEREIQAANWQELQAGDVIKCVAGHGCYFRKENGDRLSLGHKGKFEVIETYYLNSKSCGIFALPLYTGGRKAMVREFIYMGDSYYDEDLCHHKEPHKIVVLKKVNNA